MDSGYFALAMLCVGAAITIVSMFLNQAYYGGLGVAIIIAAAGAMGVRINSLNTQVADLQQEVVAIKENIE